MYMIMCKAAENKSNYWVKCLNENTTIFCSLFENPLFSLHKRNDKYMYEQPFCMAQKFFDSGCINLWLGFSCSPPLWRVCHWEAQTYCPNSQNILFCFVCWHLIRHYLIGQFAKAAWCWDHKECRSYRWIRARPLKDRHSRTCNRDIKRFRPSGLLVQGLFS